MLGYYYCPSCDTLLLYFFMTLEIKFIQSDRMWLLFIFTYVCVYVVWASVFKFVKGLDYL